ncbi:MAG: hypothetical protein ACLFUE_08435, partial [Desulfobacteraceae bacterium]
AGTSRRSRGRGDPLQLSLFAGRDDRLRNWIRELDINNIMPMEALEMLNRLKGYVNGDRADQAGHQQETS